MRATVAITVAVVAALATACAPEAPREDAPFVSGPVAPPSAEAEAVDAALLSSADADADAGASDAGAKPLATPPPAPLVRTLTPPEAEKSPLPKPAEWTDVPRREVVVKPEYECLMQAVREWHRIRCNATNATVALVAGTRDGVTAWSNADEAHMFFPVRKGDARVFELSPRPRDHMVPGVYGFSFFSQPGGPPVVISEVWLDGEDAPTITVQ